MPHLCGSPTLSDYAVIWISYEVSRVAEQSLAKVEVLLADAGKRIENGFVPSEVFSLERWRASVPVAA